MRHPLTIFIPTYNRVEELEKTLESLLRQINNRTRIVVLDNCSSDSTDLLVEGLQTKYPAVRLDYIRNRANVGLCGNLLKCFEYCETEWLWILGDDDSPSDDAYEQIICHIDKASDEVFFNFETTISRNRVTRSVDAICSTTSDFIEALDHFGNLLFISSSIYRVSTFQQHLAAGYTNATTWAPHIGMVLAELEAVQNSKFVFATGLIVHWSPNTKNDGWQNSAHTEVVNGIHCLPLLIEDQNLRTKLWRKIAEVHPISKVAAVFGFDSDAKDDWIEMQNQLGGMALSNSSERDSFVRFTFQLWIRSIFWHPKSEPLRKILRIIRYIKRRIK